MTNCCQVYGHKEKADEPRQRGNSGAHGDCDGVGGGVGVGGGHGGYGDGNRYGGAGVIIIFSLYLSL